jgi:hypothetical protein
MKTTLRPDVRSGVEIQTLKPGDAFAYDGDVHIVLEPSDLNAPVTGYTDRMPATSVTLGRVGYFEIQQAVFPLPDAFIVHDIAEHIADILRRMQRKTP